MPSRNARKAGNIANPQAPKPATTCKTCSTCRRKKIKCSGTRPQCMACSESHQPCVYPRDARKDTRPSRVRLLDLEATMAAMIEQIRDAGGMPHQDSQDMEEDEQEGPDLTTVDTPEWTGPELPFPTPTASSTTTHDRYQQPGGMSPEESSELQLGTSHLERTSRDTNNRNDSQRRSLAQPDITATSDEQPDGLSPCEARVAGVYHEDGCVSSVHGLAGIMNPTRRAFHKENISKVSRKGEAAVAGSKARLISNAILQKQREGRIFKQPQQSIDLDGCDPELARHLIDVHFNGNYPACMATYRSAILESIACNGPWVNKLLLNAIFYSSSLQSGRKSILGFSDDPQSVRSRFYSRFSQLLGQALVHSSIPSATALLLVSSTLLSEGKASAAWNLSGTAYRMVVDLGCHMMLASDYEEVKFQSSSQMLHKDIEHESRKRLYWTAYVTDVTQSLCLGRQCSFATTEARVPLMLLDTFEELNEWEPYLDPTEPAPTSRAYVSQSAYAVSSFISLVKLMRIGAQVTRLYGIETVGQTTETIMREKHSIESQLTHWLETLPEELAFSPGDNNAVPPPHHIVPYTTYHTFRILLYRALTEEGHLRRHTDPNAKRVSEQECIASALAIEDYVQAYRKTFSLRRAPFLLCYAVYSAVAIILPQERHDRGNFTSIIAFFWTCLGELQQGCNLGLKKPLSVLRNMAREFELSSKELGGSAVAGRASAQQEHLPRIEPGTLDGSYFPQLPLTTQNLGQQPFADTHYLTDFGMQNGAGQFGTETAFGLPGSSDFLNDQEWGISQNTLYGLFAPFPQ